MNYLHKLSSAVLLACVVAPALTSCEDMLAPTSDLVTYEEDNTISSVNDTLYSVLGVINLMQQVADRANLLGEVRADLVTVTPAATTDLQDLASFDVKQGNKYNRPQDYYAIINNCNYYIANADTSYTKSGVKVFERELAVMHTFRAWAYMQLATTYGNVPFYTHFLGTLEAANEVMKQPRQDMQTIFSFLLEDLRPYIKTYALDYGTISQFNSQQFFIPVRVMMAELCLWLGRYQEAAQLYHDYITDIDDPKPIYYNRASWNTNEVPATYISDSYSTSYRSLSSIFNIAYIPMESNTFNGTISYLDDLYCSTEDNDYYYQLTYSPAMVNLSAAQAYYYLYTDNSGQRDTICMTTDSIRAQFNDRKREGDLRLYTLVSERSVNSGNTSDYNSTYQEIRKFSTGSVILFTLPVIYLHYAEALNRAGFPTAAFAVLKYGLCPENLFRPDDVIDPHEREQAGTLLSFDRNTFDRSNTTGIHSRGSGESEYNPEYVMPMPAQALASYADTVAYQTPLVEDLIIDELALEACFDGTRFYDLLRVALRRSDAAYLADRVARRSGSTDEGLRSRLMQQSAWYLPLE